MQAGGASGLASPAPPAYALLSFTATRTKEGLVVLNRKRKFQTGLNKRNGYMCEVLPSGRDTKSYQRRGPVWLPLWERTWMNTIAPTSAFGKNELRRKRQIWGRDFRLLLLHMWFWRKVWFQFVFNVNEWHYINCKVIGRVLTFIGLFYIHVYAAASRWHRCCLFEDGTAVLHLTFDYSIWINSINLIKTFSVYQKCYSSEDVRFRCCCRKENKVINLTCNYSWTCRYFPLQCQTLVNAYSAVQLQILHCMICIINVDFGVATIERILKVSCFFFQFSFFTSDLVWA